MEDFEKIYQEYGKTVYFFLLSLSGNASLSEELTQETMFRAILHSASFRGDCQLPTWLCQIAKNLYYEWQRKNKRLRPIEAAEQAVSDSGELAEKLVDRELARRILTLAHEMEEPYKEVFLLHALGDVPLTQISALFGKSDSWARVTYYRAKAKIRERMEKGER